MRKKAKAVVGRVDVANAPSDKVTGQHPLLREAKINAATKTAYLNGCVLASVLRTGKSSRKAYGVVRRIGYSLQMTAEEIRESFAVVGGLSGEREKSRFFDEMSCKLKKRPVRRYFMLDIDRVLKADGNISDEIAEMVNYIGTVLFGVADWRGKMVADGRRRKKKGKGKKIFRRARRNTVFVMDDDKEDKSIYPEWWDPIPIKDEKESATQFYIRVKAMVEKMERYVHDRFHKGKMSEYDAKRILSAAENVLSDVDINTELERYDEEQKGREKRDHEERKKRIRTGLSRIKKRYGDISERQLAMREFLWKEGLSDDEVEKYVDREVESFRKKYPGLYEYDAPYIPENDSYLWDPDDD